MSVQVKGSGTIGGIDEGLVVSGIVTATELDISGNIDVDGHTNLDNVSIAGVTTSINKVQVNSLGIGIVPIDHHHIHIESANPRILIRSTGTNAQKILFGDNSSNDSGVIEYAHSSNTMIFNTANSPRLRINSSGQLLIKGTSAVGSGTGLEVTYDASSVLGRVLAQGFIARDNYGASTNAGNSMYSPSANTLAFSTNSNERLRIDNQGNVKSGTVTSALNFTDSNSGNTKSIEVGATGGGDALFVTHSSGYGVGYFGYEAGGDRLVIACDGGGGNNKIDFITDAGTSTGGGTDNLNAKVPKMRISAAGYVTKPSQPSFAATRSAGDVTNAVAVFNSVKFNVGNNYNNTNGRFTAPIAGKYQFSFAGMAYGASADFQARLRKNGSNHFNSNGSGRGYGTFEPYGFTVLIDLAKDDYVEIYVYSSNNSAKFYMTGTTWNIFSGYLVG